jgi:serine/threonine-protein kinase RsbT
VGVEVVFEDQGPGIANIEDTLRDGVTLASGRGLGLSKAKRFMDELVVHSKRNVGTTVVIRMWKS